MLFFVKIKYRKLWDEVNGCIDDCLFIYKLWFFYILYYSYWEWILINCLYDWFFIVCLSEIVLFESD